MVPNVGDASNRYRCPCTGLVAPNTDESSTYAAELVPRFSVSASGVVADVSSNTAPVLSENVVVCTV